MLAALLLNIGNQPPAAPPLAVRFGGGPFYRRYGYDSAYDSIREQQEQTSSALQALETPVVVPVIARPQITKPLVIDEWRIRNAVRTAVRKDYFEPDAGAEDDDEFMQVLLLLGD